MIDQGIGYQLHALGAWMWERVLLAAIDFHDTYLQRVACLDVKRVCPSLPVAIISATLIGTFVRLRLAPRQDFPWSPKPRKYRIESAGTVSESAAWGMHSKILAMLSRDLQLWRQCGNIETWLQRASPAGCLPVRVKLGCESHIKKSDSSSTFVICYD